MVEEWERKKGESGKCFSWFTVYRDLGPSRNLPKAYDKLVEISKAQEEQGMDNAIPVPSYETFKKRCGTWHWVKRARRYDNYLDEMARVQKEQDYLRIEGRLLGIGEKLLDNLEDNLSELHLDVESKVCSVSHALKSAADAYDKSVKDIRLLYGRSTENTNNKGELSVDAEVDTKAEVAVDVTSQDFMNQELEYMRELLEK